MEQRRQRAPSHNTEPKMFNVAFYRHRVPFTIRPEDEVEKVEVVLILTPQLRKNTKWRLDCVDLPEQLDHYAGRTTQLVEARNLLLRGIIRAIAREGINPSEVTGYQEWFKHTNSLDVPGILFEEERRSYQ